MGYGDVPSNVSRSQLKLKSSSKSGPLPKQRSGVHTKALSEFANMSQSKVAQSLVDFAAKGGKMSTAVSNVPVSQHGASKKQQMGMQQQLHAQSSIHLKNYASQNDAQRYNNQHRPPPPVQRGNYQRALPPAHGHPHSHHHAQTFGQIAYNYQQTHQLPNQQQQQMQYQQQLMAMQHAQSQINLNQQYQAQQQHMAAMQNNQNLWNSKSMTNMNDSADDDDHASFVPPAPHQDAARLNQWKAERKMRDKQKKEQRRQQQQANNSEW